MVAAPAEAVRADPFGSRDQLARDNLVVFTKRMFPGYAPAAHHWRIAAALQAVAAGDLSRLVITVPPRHGKSALASVHFPAWFLGNHPDQRVIACSYSAALAYRFSRQARNLLADPRWPFPGVATAGDAAAVEAWDIAGRRGGYVAAGVSGSVTGMGADVLAIDDPVKSAEEADSATYRERAWEWFTQTALTRLEPGGRVVLVGTRWHADDLIGRALNAPGMRWEHLDLPALDDDGNALWPERFDAAALLRIREQIGTRAFEALYQQRPSPEAGSIFRREWWAWHDAEPLRWDWLVTSWDTAFKAGQSADWSVGLTLGLAGDRIHVVDRWRARAEFPDLKRAVRDQWLRHRPDEILVEDAASGQSLVQELAAPVSAPDPWRDVAAMPVVAVRPDRDKVARANAVSPHVEAGRVSLPRGAAWADELVEECAAFPFGAHDDQVDALTQGVRRLVDRAQSLWLDPGVAAAFERVG